MENKTSINKILDEFIGIEIIKTRPKEAITFAKRYFKNKHITAIEIGVLRGVNSKEILKNLNVDKLYLIDPWLSYLEYRKSEPRRTQNSLNKDFRICKQKLNRYSKKIEYIKKFSHEAINLVPVVDFIYIDGNHEYEYVKKDLEMYWKKIKKGGILSGHDIQYLGVSRALLDFAKKNKLEILFGDRRDWWIIK